MSSGMTYFEIFGIEEDVTDEDQLLEAYSAAQRKWQTLLNQGIGSKARLARQVMDGELQAAYETLTDPTRRLQYKRKLDLERGQAQGAGQIDADAVEVNFSLGGRFGDYSFKLSANPVRHPLILSEALQIHSVQEYICRTLENRNLGLETFEDRTLERWLYYSADASEVADAIKYYKWKDYQLPQERLFNRTLDLLQAEYPVPVLPHSPSSIRSDSAPQQSPQWDVVPSVINLGLIPQTGVSTPVFIRYWKTHPGNVEVSSNNPLIWVDVARLASNHEFTVRVDGDQLNRGDEIQGIVTVTSEVYGDVQLPVLGARSRIIGNAGLARQINLQAAQYALSQRDYVEAARTLKLAGLSYESQTAEVEIIRNTYHNHDWNSLIERVRSYHNNYGRSQETSTYLVEALRVVAGTHYQLAQYELALPYLASLASETPYLIGQKLPDDNWSVQPEAQIKLNPTNPKQDWVNVAEQLDLRWTHREGSADRSGYAGPMPLDLRGRHMVWQTDSASFAPPIIAYEGVLVARTQDNRAVFGLDAATGQPIWQHTQGLTGKAISAPVAGKGSVFVTDPAGSLYCLDILSGTENWRMQLNDSRDLTLTLENDTLYVATGTQVLFINAIDGTEVKSTREMKGQFGGGANPVNMLVTHGRYAYQKAVFRKQTLAFGNLQNGRSIEYDTPYALTPPVTWTAHDNEVYIPMLVTKQLRCKFVDSSGNVREQTQATWDSLHLQVYKLEGTSSVTSLETPIGRYPREYSIMCNISTKNPRTASACGVAPVHVQAADDSIVISPPKKDQQIQHRLIAASFDQDIYYWLSTENSVSMIGQRRADAKVQSIIFANVHDMVVSTESLSTSLAGNTDGSRVSTYSLPDDVRPIVGTPALYGDVIYVVSKTGRIAAISR